MKTNDGRSDVTRIDEIEGGLCLEVGSGWASSFEVANLKSGDLLVTENLAGQAMTLTFNGNFLAQAQLVVLDGKGGLGAARIKSFEDPSQLGPSPDRGTELFELVPFTIRVARVKYSLCDLYGAGITSLVHLNTTLGEACGVSLIVAGIEVAQGTLMVRDEKWAIRIDSIKGRIRAGKEIRTTMAHVAVGTYDGNVKVYDPRRPDWVTKPMVCLLEDIHAEFLRSLHVVCPGAETIRLESVDQLAFCEWVVSKPPLEAAVRVCSMVPTGKTSTSTKVTELPSKLCINPRNTDLALLDQDFEAEYKTWWQNTPASLDTNLCLISVPKSLDTLVPLNDERQFLTGCLRNGWKRVIDVKISEKRQIEAGWSRESMYSMIDQWAMILIAVFTIQTTQGKEYFELIYPLTTLQTHCAQFRT